MRRGVVSGSVLGREGGRTIGGGVPPSPTQIAVATSVKRASKWVSYAAPSSPVSDS